MKLIFKVNINHINFINSIITKRKHVLGENTIHPQQKRKQTRHNEARLKNVISQVVENLI